MEGRGRELDLLVLALILAAQTRVPPTALAPDPATDLVRVRAFLTTTSPAVDLTITGAEWGNAAPALSSVRAIIDGQTLHVTTPILGQTDVQIDMILASVHAHQQVTWTITPASPGASALEIQNLNLSAPSTVDRFDAGSGIGHFVESADLLRAGGPLPAPPTVKQHLVLAFFYPWYDLSTWSSPQLIDGPVVPYSTDDPVDLQRLMSTAASVGLDALVMSWSGPDVNGGIDDLRMLRCLDAASATGFKMATLLETTSANPQHVDGTADPDTVLAWLIDIVDDYASHPAYLRAGGRPVVFAYNAQRMSQAGWTDVLARLRASGRDVLLVGEGINSTRLGAFDGQFFYASNDYQGDAIRDFDRGQSLNVRTYQFLPGHTVGRRAWVATVSPGYDDTQMNDGRVPRVTDRDGGTTYERQWRAAFDNRADWIVITSWNEYFENTEIEATRRYGDHYLTLTKSLSALFRQLNPVAVPRAK